MEAEDRIVQLAANRIDYARIRWAVCWGVVLGLFFFLLIVAAMGLLYGIATGVIDEFMKGNI